MDSIIFGEVCASDREAYIRTTLTNWWAGQQRAEVDLAQIDAAAAQVLMADGSGLPDLVPEAELPVVSDEAEAENRARTACLLHGIRGGLPRIGGESVPSFTVSCLAKTVGEHPAGAVVCRRESDHADLYILPRGWSYVAGHLDFAAPAGPSVPAASPASPPLVATPVLAASSPVGALAMSFGKGLLGSIGGKLGAALFDAIIPAGVPSYFDQVYAEIDKLMKTQITQNTINKMDGEMSGLQTWVANSYDADKASGNYTKADLTARLQPKADDLAINVLGVLSQKAFRDPSLSVFMIASCFHLALLQELAIQDPKVTDPKKSANALSVSKYALTYAKQVTTAFDEVVAHRKSLIKVNYVGTQVCVLSHCSMKDAYNFVDSYADHTGPTYDSYEEHKNPVSGSIQAQADADVWSATEIAQLTTDLHNPMALVADWKKLALTPVS